MKRWQLTSFWAGVIFFLFAISTFPLFHSSNYAASRDDSLVVSLVNNLTHANQPIRLGPINALEEPKNPAAIPAFIELLRFNSHVGISTVPALQSLPGTKLGDNWSKWVEWLQQH